MATATLSAHTDTHTSAPAQISDVVMTDVTMTDAKDKDQNKDQNKDDGHAPFLFPMLFPNVNLPQYLHLNDPTGGKYNTFNAAGIWRVVIDANGYMWSQFVLQRKQREETKQWDNCLSFPSGKVAKHPDSINKKTKLPLAQPSDPSYDALVQRYLRERHTPCLTAVRECAEETRLTPASIGARFDHRTLALLNNGYKRHLEALKSDPLCKKVPFICVTYVTFENGDPSKIDQGQFSATEETTALVWVRLDTLFPAKDTDEFKAFEAEVFVGNHNYVLPSSCHTLPRAPSDSPYSMASYTARSISNDLETVLSSRRV